MLYRTLTLQATKACVDPLADVAPPSEWITENAECVHHSLFTPWWYKYVRITTNQPDTKHNPNANPKPNPNRTVTT